MITATKTPPPILGTKPMTVEEYAELPNDGRYTELVRGRVVEMPQPQFLHGLFCANIVFLLSAFIRARDLGRILSNDSGIITERDPDSLRGADVAYFSYSRVAKGERPKGYPSVSPELVFEVNSPSDRWNEVLAKVSEYLNAGVMVVCVLDPATQSLHVYRPEGTPTILTIDDELTLPDVLPDFRMSVRQLFE